MLSKTTKTSSRNKTTGDISTMSDVNVSITT